MLGGLLVKHTFPYSIISYLDTSCGNFHISTAFGHFLKGATCKICIRCIRLVENAQ